MDIKQSFLLAIKSLATSKMRALLTMLGIIVGVGAVIIIISLGDGMKKMMNDEFASIGANMIQVNLYWTGGSHTPTEEDMYDLVREYPKYLTAVSPYVMVGSTNVRSSTDSFAPSSILGVSEEYLSIRGQSIQSGRFLQYVDINRMQMVCVVGTYINNTYFNGNAVGETLMLGGYNYTVVGVLAETGDSTEKSADDVILLPYPNAGRLSGMETTLYIFSGANAETAAMARGIIEQRMDEIYQMPPEENWTPYYVSTSAEMLDMMNTMMNTLMIVLVAIAALSLLVGGIGIMNIMLVSVTERTREIGVRKSLGAKRRDIRSQFIIESATTSAVGGVIGILFGIVMANLAGVVVSAVSGQSFAAIPSVTAIGVAFGVSVAVGVFFGYMPANKAAKLNPIDALRFD